LSYIIMKQETHYYKWGRELKHRARGISIQKGKIEYGGELLGTRETRRGPTGFRKKERKKGRRSCWVHSGGEDLAVRAMSLVSEAWGVWTHPDCRGGEG